MFSKKFKKWFYIFTCITPDYMGVDNNKEILKNSHFENITADFLQRCQNLVRRKCKYPLYRVVLWRHSYVERVFPDLLFQNIVKFFVRNSHDFVEWTWAIQSEYETLINHSASKTKNSIWVKNNFGVIQQLRGQNFANL